jgi:hypothetical protein
MVAGLQMSCSQHQGCRCCQGMGNFLWGRCLWTTCASWCLLGVMVSIQSRNSGPLPKVRCFLHAEKEPHNTMLYQFKSIYHWICQSIGISWKVALWLYIYICYDAALLNLEHLWSILDPKHIQTWNIILQRLASVATFSIFLLTWEVSESSGAAVCAALVMSIIPAHLMRSMTGRGWCRENRAFKRI